MNEAVLIQPLAQEKEKLSTWSDKLMLFSLSGFSFLLAWGLFRFYNLNFPIIYNGGDVTFMSWLIKRVIDGRWYFNSVYSGFPFGSTFLDFPISDTGNFIVCKLLGALTHSYILTFNLYFLLGFSVTSVISYVVLQKLAIHKAYAATGAILFTFLPFHFLRLGHLWYTWYFNVPIFVWFAFKIFSKDPLFFESEQRIREKLKPCFLLLVLTCFGVYFAFFSTLMLLASGIAGSLKWKSTRNIASACLAILILIMGVGINIAPNLVYAYNNGHNHEIAPRFPAESEVYGLKLSQMLLPQPAHRFQLFSDITAKYNKDFPLVNENISSALGLVGSIGLLILLGVAIGSPFFRFSVDSRLQLLAFLTLFLFLVATIGGLASLFALLVSPMIRGWNRISVFIGFMSITALFLCTEKLLKRVIQIPFLKSISIGVCFFLLGFGIWDQTGVPSQLYLQGLKQQFLSDRHFVQKIEQLIPGGAVYQLPYTPIGDGVAVKNVSYLISFDLFRGYLHSSSLHWSSGGTIGRKGDLFFRQLAEQPLARQIETIKTLGFNGIYIERRGYLDHGAAIEKELAKILGSPETLLSEDNNLAFFAL